MKIITIGDLHGHTLWKDIINKEESDTDLFVFMGDYFDSKTISAHHQKENFKDIIAFKKKNVDKVILLFGNHEHQYQRTSRKQYSGYQSLHAIDIRELIHNAIDENLLQMCHIQDNFLFSHAGVTKTWCESSKIDLKNIEQSINDLFKYKPNHFEFAMGGRFSDIGDDVTQTPIWVRPRSLAEDKIDGYIQIVGHTGAEKLITTGDIILTDTLGTSGEYLEINNGILTAKTI